MSNIQSLKIEYVSKIDHLDLDLIISHVIKKSREFILAHPEYELSSRQMSKVKRQLLRRMREEPLAYILGYKEFYGLNFKVNKHTLIPRPETELLVELALQHIKTLQQKNNLTIVDVGTGSGNIIISTALNSPQANVAFYGIDISQKALAIAKYNAKKNKVAEKIKFIEGNLLEPFDKKMTSQSNVKCQKSMVILANLPYLSQEIYNSAPITVKKYEPKSALYSADHGLDHYDKLLQQIKELLVKCQLSTVTCFIEISPEQKLPIQKLIKQYFPQAKTSFFRDLAGKWRIVKIEI